MADNGKRIRAARPDILISGDFIVGFPEETDQDFEDTMNLIAEIGFDHSAWGGPGCHLDNGLGMVGHPRQTARPARAQRRPPGQHCRRP